MLSTFDCALLFSMIRPFVGSGNDCFDIVQNKITKVQICLKIDEKTFTVSSFLRIFNMWAYRQGICSHSTKSLFGVGFQKSFQLKYRLPSTALRFKKKFNIFLNIIWKSNNWLLWNFNYSPKGSFYKTFDTCYYKKYACRTIYFTTTTTTKKTTKQNQLN